MSKRRISRPSITCGYCGRVVHRRGNGDRTPKYCDGNCANRAIGRQKAERVKTITKACEQCGKTFSFRSLGPVNDAKRRFLRKFLCRDMAELATGAAAAIQGVDRPSLGLLEGQEAPRREKEDAEGQPDAQSGKRGEGEQVSSGSDVSVARREREADGTAETSSEDAARSDGVCDQHVETTPFSPVTKSIGTRMWHTSLR